MKVLGHTEVSVIRIRMAANIFARHGRAGVEIAEEEGGMKIYVPARHAEQLAPADVIEILCAAQSPEPKEILVLGKWSAAGELIMIFTANNFWGDEFRKLAPKK